MVELAELLVGAQIKKLEKVGVREGVARRSSLDGRRQLFIVQS